MLATGKMRKPTPPSTAPVTMGRRGPNLSIIQPTTGDSMLPSKRVSEKTKDS